MKLAYFVCLCVFSFCTLKRSQVSTNASSITYERFITFFLLRAALLQQA